MESQFFKSFSGKIMNIPDEEYHNNKDYLSASSMKLLKKSPMHYKEHEQETTDAMVFGSAYHCFILEEDKFKDRYFILDESEILSILLGEGSKSPRATNKYKEWKEGQLARAEGKILLDDNTFVKMQKMKRRLFQHPFARMLLTNGEPELAIFAVSELQNRPLEENSSPWYSTLRIAFVLQKLIALRVFLLGWKLVVAVVLLLLFFLVPWLKNIMSEIIQWLNFVGW